MRQFFTLVRKEFLHIMRDQRSLFVLFGMPIMQVLIFGFALSNEVKDSRIAVLDESKDAYTEGVVQKLDASQYFEIERNLTSIADIERAFQSGKIKMAVVFAPNFKDQLLRTNKAQVQLITDASDPNTATTVINYAAAIIAEYNQSIVKTPAELPLSIGIETRMLYNPQLRGEYNFVPGVMAMILMLISAMMTSVAIVREKELGTMEVLLVSPMRPIWVILSKMMPFLLLSIVNFTTILLLAVHVLGLPIKGDLGLLFAVSIVYIICSLALGLLISTIAESQQVAMFLALGGLMMPTILFSGFMFPLENLPLPMQIISNIIPAKWYFIIVRNIMIKGLAFDSIWRETAILGFMTVVLLAVSLSKFKTRLE
jgi:ABC-2 type transport system permease protein